MAKFKNGNLIIGEGKKISIGDTDIVETSFEEVLNAAEDYADLGDSSTLSTANSNIQFRAGDVRTVVTDTTASSGEILLVDASSGNVTIYIQSIINSRITIKKIDDSINQVRVVPTYGLIEEFEKIVLIEQYAFIDIVCDGDNWWSSSSNTVRDDLSLSSSSSSSSSNSSSSSSTSSSSRSSSSSSTSSSSRSSSSRSSSSSSTPLDSLPAWLSGFPFGVSDHIQVVIGTAWKENAPFSEDDVINLYKVYGQTIWTENGTEDPSVTNRLKFMLNNSTSTFGLVIYAATEELTNMTSAGNVSFTTGVVGATYTFKEFFDAATGTTVNANTYIMTAGSVPYKNGVFKSMTFISG